MTSLIPAPPLLEQLRLKIRLKGYSRATESNYSYWTRRFILFHDKRHPREMGLPEVEAFLSHVASHDRSSAATQNQALSALLFLYRNVLEQPFVDAPVNALRARRYDYIPTVLTVDEVRRLFDAMSGTQRLMAELTYGAGLRVSETHRLRVQDVDFQNRRILIRDGKGRKDRFTLLPECLLLPMQKQLLRVKSLHADDLARGYGASVTPGAYARRSSHASKEFTWQFVFPSSGLFHDAGTGISGRWHLNMSTFQKTIRSAAREAGIVKRVTAHALRHSFATHLLLGGCDIRRIQLLLGHTHINTTMVYAHIADAYRLAVTSPLDAFGSHAAMNDPTPARRPVNTDTSKVNARPAAGQAARPALALPATMEETADALDAAGRR